MTKSVRYSLGLARGTARKAMKRYLFALWLTVALAGCATGKHELARWQARQAYDPQVQQEVDREVRDILQVTPHRDQAYRVYLILGLKSSGIAGLSLGEAEPGQRVILVDYELIRQSLSADRWWARMLLAHEIGHEAAGHRASMDVQYTVLQGINLTGQVLGHVPVFPVNLIGAALGWGSWGASHTISPLYGRKAELQADRNAIEYWKRLGWDCGYWVNHFQSLADRGEEGDFRHPTAGRLEQALRLCLSPVEQEAWRKAHPPRPGPEPERGEPGRSEPHSSLP